MTEERLKNIAAVIAAKKVQIGLQEARDLAKRAIKFQEERGRVPDILSSDPWEKRMAEGVAALKRFREKQKND